MVFQVLFFFFLSLVPSKTEKLELDKATVLCLLEKCNESKYTTIDLPSKGDVTNAVMNLAHAAELTWMDLITYTYSFLDAKANTNVLDAFRRTNTAISVKRANETEWKKRRQTALLEMARRDCSQAGRDAELVPILISFIDNMDNMEALENYSMTVTDLRNEKGFANFNIHFREYFIGKFLNNIKEATKDRNINDLPVYWQFVVDSQCFGIGSDGSYHENEVSSNFYKYFVCFEVRDAMSVVGSTTMMTTNYVELFYGYIKERMKDDPERFVQQAEHFCHSKSKIGHR